jgi:hypothetical protein
MMRSIEMDERPLFIGEPEFLDDLSILRPGAVGTEQRVRGQIVQEYNCAEALSGKKIHLQRWFLIPDRGGYRKLSRYELASERQRLVLSGRDLPQGTTVASTVVGDDGSFTFKWKALVLQDRTPYVSGVYHVSEETVDPEDPLGFMKITVQEVYEPSMAFERGGLSYFIAFNPLAQVQFWGDEQDKNLPPLTAICFPNPEG